MKVSESPAQGYIELCKIGDLAEHRGNKFIVDETEIAVFLINKKIYALSNICPHQHASIIHDGIIEDGYVICPSHAWKFSLDDGKQPDGRRGLDYYPLIIHDDKVFIKFHKKSFGF